MLEKESRKKYFPSPLSKNKLCSKMLTETCVIINLTWKGWFFDGLSESEDRKWDVSPTCQALKNQGYNGSPNDWLKLGPFGAHQNYKFCTSL